MALLRGLIPALNLLPFGKSKRRTGEKELFLPHRKRCNSTVFINPDVPCAGAKVLAWMWVWDGAWAAHVSLGRQEPCRSLSWVRVVAQA